MHGLSFQTCGVQYLPASQCLCALLRTVNVIQKPSRASTDTNDCWKQIRGQSGLGVFVTSMVDVNSTEIKVADPDVNQAAQQGVGDIGGVAEHPFSNHTNEQPAPTNPGQQSAQNNPTSAEDKQTSDGLKAEVWNDKLKKGASQFFAFVAKIVAGKETPFKTPYDLLDMLDKSKLVDVLYKEELSSMGSNVDKKEAKKLKKKFDENKPVLMQLLKDRWLALADRTAEEEASQAGELQKSQQAVEHLQNKLEQAQLRQQEAESSAVAQQHTHQELFKELKSERDAAVAKAKELQAHTQERPLMQKIVEEAYLVNKDCQWKVPDEGTAQQRLAERLRASGCQVEPEKPFLQKIGNTTHIRKCDLFIDGKVAIEIKVTEGITFKDVKQLLNYMNLASTDHGLLLHYPKAGHIGAPQALYHKSRGPAILEELLPSIFHS